MRNCSAFRQRSARGADERQGPVFFGCARRPDWPFLLPGCSDTLPGMAELFDSTFMKKLELLTISARRAFRGQMRGEQRSPRTGSSVEFADYRQYSPGDDYRRIDWNAFARFDNLLLKLFREEEDLHLYLLCDASASMRFGRPDKFDYARKVAAALSYIALSNADRVSVYMVGQAEGSPVPVRDSLGPRRGKGTIFEIFEFLQSATTGGQADWLGAVKFLLSRKAKPGVAAICSDLLARDGFEAAVERLSYEKFQPMLVHVLAPQEISPPLTGDLRLLDSETGAHVDVSSSKRVAKAYAENLARFLRNTEQFAARHAMEYVFASTDAPFEDLVLRWMRQANIVS